MFSEHASEIKLGTVGWEADDSHFDLGDQTNDGLTLVKVQLYEGRDSSTPLSQEPVGQGHKILCQLASHMMRIPPAGTRVHVSLPRGMESTPGAAVIIAAVEKDRRYNLTDGSLELSTRDGAAKVVVRNDGSIALFTTNDNTDDGKSVYIRVAKDGIRFVAPWGVIKFDDTGFHVTTSSGASFDLGGIYGLPSPMDQLSTYCSIKAAMIDGRCSGASFGAGTTPVADATTVASALSNLQNQIGLIMTALSALQGDPTHTASAAATSTAAAAVVAGTTAVGTLVTQVPKGLTSV